MQIRRNNVVCMMMHLKFKSLETIRDEIEAARKLGVEFVIIPTGKEKCRSQIAIPQGK